MLFIKASCSGIERSQRSVYQSEGSQDRQALDIGEAELHQTEANDDAVKDVPALLEVVVGIQRNQLQHHLGSEDPCKHLEKGSGRKHNKAPKNLS